MDTAQEALFRAMLNEGWFTASDGDVEASPGFFGYVTNEVAEIPEILDAFEETVDAYGAPEMEEIVGSFVAIIDYLGFIYIVRCDDSEDAKKYFEGLRKRYRMVG